ncbi:hypothetical protein [Krasilnikovia cinnamomea]|uniref:hypothetical protein n=1 Tax=Krasilnikovia cinnamomea TaxID=349313 RepID=UPI00102C96C2|nr:hypothetical protein [Krasilnikovia cinnamomea]
MSGTAVMAVVTVGLVLGAGQAVASGDLLTAGLLAAGALVLGHAAGFGLSVSRHPRRGGPVPYLGVTEQGVPGLAFRYAGAPCYWFLGMLTVGAVAALGIAVVLAVGGGMAGWIVGGLLAAGAVFVGWFIVVALRLMPGRLVLTPDGVYHRALTFEYYVPWFAVYEVVAADTDHPMIVVKAHPSDGTRLHRPAGRLGGAVEAEYLPFLVVRAYWLRGNTVRAYQALDHYFRNPDRRSELSSAQPLGVFGSDSSTSGGR